MFERYTEKARRVIFFARYEASQFGSSYIETEHLLLGLLREDKALAYRFLRSQAALESIRRQIEEHTAPGEKVSTSVDLPLSHQCKRVLAYGAEEAERLNHQHIDPQHLLIGLLREESGFAAQLLGERGLNVALVRAQIQQPQAAPVQSRSASFAGLDRWIAGMEARGGIDIVRSNSVANSTAQFAIYAADPPKEDETGQDLAVADQLAEIRKRIDGAVGRMESAIANHEFDKARFYSDEERKERENMRRLCEQFHVEEPPPRVPLLCIEVIRGERFSEIQKRCDGYLIQGVPEVWLLDPDLQRAYTVTKADGLRECKSGILRIANPPLEMDLRTIFD